MKKKRPKLPKMHDLSKSTFHLKTSIRIHRTPCPICQSRFLQILLTLTSFDFITKSMGPDLFETVGNYSQFKSNSIALSSKIEI